MKKVFEHPTSHEVGFCESILRSHGIKTFLRNDNVTTLGGGVLVASAYPELWVAEDEDYDRAVALLLDCRRGEPPPAADWVCSHCGESVPGELAVCWNCQAAPSGAESSLPPPEK